MRAEWAKIRRKSNPDEFIAQPAQDHRRKVLTRYVVWNEKTKVGKFKEVGEPLMVLGHFDTLDDLIRHVMRMG